jgi:predicted nuclease with TOPRIM domain
MFGSQIEQLLAELNELQAVYEGVKQKISELQSRRAVLVEEIEIARAPFRSWTPT